MSKHDFAREEIGDSGEADVRMRSDIQAAARRERGRTHLVPEDEGADRPPPCRGERPTHLEAAQVARARRDDGFQTAAGAGVRDGLRDGLPAHRPDDGPSEWVDATVLP